MRYSCCLLLLFLFSCGHLKQPGNSGNLPADTSGKTADTFSTQPPPTRDSLPGPSALAASLNQWLKEKSGGPWQVADDATANWPKDEFDYFIAPKRKDQPDYPYIIKGDFNGDGKEDAAALVLNPANREYQLAIIESFGTESAAARFWKEDMDLSALSLYPKGDLDGINGEKVKMKGDGITVEYYEKSSFVIYRSGTGYKRVWTGD